MIDDSSSREAKGERVRAIRDWLRLARADLERKYGIKANTLQSWEDARFGGLTEKGARQLVKACDAEGVPCTLEWLLHGVGKDPLPPNFANRKVVTARVAKSVANITEELRLFYQSYADGVDTIVADDGMAPCLLPGDHVAGQRYFGEEIVKALNTSCIVHTQAAGVLVRTLIAGTKEGCYTLTCINPQTTVAEPTLTNVILFSAAPIIWFRRPVNGV